MARETTEEKPSTPNRMYEWLGIYVVAPGPEEALGYIAGWHVDDEPGYELRDYMEDRLRFPHSGREPDLGRYEPRSFLREIRPDEWLDIPDEYVPESSGVGALKLQRKVRAGFTYSVNAYVYHWCLVLEASWMWDTED